MEQREMLELGAEDDPVKKPEIFPKNHLGEFQRKVSNDRHSKSNINVNININNNN